MQEHIHEGGILAELTAHKDRGLETTPLNIVQNGPPLSDPAQQSAIGMKELSLT